MMKDDLFLLGFRLDVCVFYLPKKKSEGEQTRSSRNTKKALFHQEHQWGGALHSTACLLGAVLRSCSPSRPLPAPEAVVVDHHRKKRTVRHPESTRLSFALQPDHSLLTVVRLKSLLSRFPRFALLHFLFCANRTAKAGAREQRPRAAICGKCRFCASETRAPFAGSSPRTRWFDLDTVINPGANSEVNTFSASGLPSLRMGQKKSMNQVGELSHSAKLWSW